MSYLTKEPVVIEVRNKIVCSHPKVKSAFEYGGVGVNPREAVEMRHYLCIVLEDGSRNDFNITSGDLSEAEKFLEQL